MLFATMPAVPVGTLLAVASVTGAVVTIVLLSFTVGTNVPLAEATAVLTGGLTVPPPTIVTSG